MSAVSVTGTTLRSGIWHGQARVEGLDAAPVLTAWSGDTALPELELRPEGEGLWALKLRVPGEILSDGLQTIVIRDEGSGDAVGSFAILAGAVLDDDIRSELALLRAELDMLKRAFRRHMNDGD